MILKPLKPRKALNKAFLKVKPNRTEIEGFKTNLITLLDRTNDTESEEFHKNLISDFLKDTYYKQNHFINTKGRNDLVIHNGQNANSTVGVIIEAKKPTNKSEMITTKKLNVKAFQELVLYYLRERITHKNLEVKHLVATNINEWFIFDATLFDRLFAQNKNLVKQFNDFEGGRLADTKTDFFYKEIAEPFIDSITSEIEFTYFNIQDFQKPLRNTDKADDNSLIALFKLLSPEHLLKLPFANDSNNLDKRFYSELLHIIGLNETKEGSKKIIERNKAGERNTGTILEDAIIQLDSLDKLNRLEKPSQFGNTKDEKLFNVALELSITWINRILFLKLLEAQLINYHKGDKSYSFLNFEKIKNYDDLNSLFFQVLARKQDERNEDVKKAFEKVPYLNSSLFEPTDIEQVTLFISNLKDEKTIPIFSQTVLKDQQGKKQTGNISTLQYLFEFLDAYDFGAEGGEDIQEDNKTLINASVLGLIFEKINGYKDGSFFTPGFITMYMCRETIRKAVVQKFNETKNWNCQDLNELYDKIEDRKEANKIVNSIKICDPAVGSGHFLVSALNEMIAVKNDLKILQDRDGKRLKEYQVEVVNDELIVTDEEGELFEYNPSSKESQRIQETLFHEKQTIIENCLFGVDINSNSVKICRLRLWIELLKNAYYISSPPLKGGVPEGGGGLIKNLPEGGGGFKLNNLPYLKTFRKELRNNLTPAEAKLWTLLKGKQMNGRKFRRQHSVGNYILDFYCPSERIAIELDGQGHFEVSQAEYDYERDLFLEAFGIRVLRFENKWVWNNPDGLLEEVKSYFGKQPPRPADTPPYKGGELQTLPNIDINIKCGNSLVSRFAIDADLKQALKKSKWTIDSYRIAVDTYRNAESKEQKREMERLIADIKSDFRSEISLNDPKVKKLRKLSGELFQMTNQQQLFEMSKKEKADWNKKVTQLTEETKKLETEIEEIKANKIFENAFEWRFEFPEVLNDDGDFVGFDVVIGNPPYGIDFSEREKEFLKAEFDFLVERIRNSFLYFIGQGLRLTRQNGILNYIVPNEIMFQIYMTKARKYFLTEKKVLSAVNLGDNVFEDAVVSSAILEIQNKAEERYSVLMADIREKIKDRYVNPNDLVKVSSESLKANFNQIYVVGSEKSNLVNKLMTDFPTLESISITVANGISTSCDKVYIVNGETIKINKIEKSVAKRTIRGSNFNKYFIDNSVDDYVVYITKDTVIEEVPNTISYLEPNKDLLIKSSVEKKQGKRDWHILFRPREESDYATPKILVRQTADRIIAAIDTEIGFYPIDTVNVVKLESEDIEFNLAVLGVLNSKLITFFYQEISQEGGRILAQVKPSRVKAVPIPNFKNTKSLSKLVQNVIDKRQENKDTSNEENQIDQLVYQLYELTEEEIKIVENG